MMPKQEACYGIEHISGDCNGQCGKYEECLRGSQKAIYRSED